MEGAPKTRAVYLPAGSGWYDFWTGEFYHGGRSVEAEAPLARIPLYVKAGSILPLGPVLEYPNQEPHPELTLRVYPGEDGSFVLYDDEGDSYRYERGMYSLTPLHWDDRCHTLTIGRREGRYPGMPQSQVFHIALGNTAKTVHVERGEELRISLDYLL